MQSTMLSQIALIFIDSFIVFYLTRSIVKALSKNNKKQTSVLVGIVAALLLSSHYAIFTNLVKEQNYFEFFGVERAYTSDFLNKKLRQSLSMYHPDKNPNSSLELFNRVSTMRNTLSDPHYQKLYDRFGEFQYVEQSKQTDYLVISSQLSLSGYVNSISFYSVLFIVSIVLSYGQKFSKYRLLSCLVLLGLQVQDLMIFAEIDEKYEGAKQGQRVPKFEVARDFYDDYIPTFSIYERLILIRYLCAALLTALRLYFDCLKEEVVNVYEDQVDQKLDIIYEKITKQVEVFKANPAKIEDQQTKGTDTTEQEPNIEKQVDSKNSLIENQQPKEAVLKNQQPKEAVLKNQQPKEAVLIQEEQKPKQFNLQEFCQNKDDLLKLKELVQKHKEEIPKDKFLWLKKGFKFCLFLLMIYSFASRFLEGDDDGQKGQQKNQYQKQQQRYQHHTQFDEDDIQY